METPTPVITDPERQFVGCLLWLRLDPARRVLAGMRADDLADPMCAQVLQLVIEVVAAGHAPCPTTVFAHATATGRAPGEERARLGMWLADTYGHTVQVPDLAFHLKAVVLEAAWRRAIAEYATRLLHAAETSPTEVLHALTDDHDSADELWQRYRAALIHATTSLEVAA
ncbi:hypothetical protein B0I33_109316 [Prauserella shujinwangii]|uniref:DnaB helicase-like protein n=1 Tax=Prauserella shujinwangii TaxID=1453103 RepID=A0A2T0LQU6_9PSEU|nr:hypothetical protein [Prauserella shujinwangii]PRX45652.1 hypothetical protein B0I33_109316 [Prauserella shujinwangii]